MKILVLNGPNIGRLGTREPDVYGHATYDNLIDVCQKAASKLSVSVDVRQTDTEGRMITWLHEATDERYPVVLNPAAWTHYSIAVRDACAALSAPLVEVHLTNVHTREEFRRMSVISPVAAGVICGLGLAGYELALQWLATAEHREHREHRSMLSLVDPSN